MEVIGDEVEMETIPSPRKMYVESLFLDVRVLVKRVSLFIYLFYSLTVKSSIFVESNFRGSQKIYNLVGL